MLTKIINHFRLTNRLFWDWQVDLKLKLFLLGIPTLYFFVPLPDDVLPVIGLLDDMAFWGLCTFLFTTLCPADRVTYHQACILGADETMAGVDAYRHPDEQRSLPVGFIIIFGIFALGGYMAGLMGMLIFAGGYITSLLTRGQMLGNAMQVTETQFPEIYNAYLRASHDLPAVKINLFVTQNPEMNAFAFGYEEPYSIVLTSGLVEKMSLPEVQGVIGHELGHVILGHVRLTSIMSVGRGILGLLFYRWSRACEYSADAVALKACQDAPEAYISALVKLSSGMVNRPVDIQQFLDQGNDDAPMNKPAEWYSTHPFIINRIQRILQLARGAGWSGAKAVPALA